MVPIRKVTEWLADHGYRDLYPRRDAVDPDVLFYTYVKEGKPRVGIRSKRGKVKRVVFEKLKKLVTDGEKEQGHGG